MSALVNEWRLLRRDRGARWVLIGWLALLTYAAYGGLIAVQAMRADQARFIATATEERAQQRAEILAVESGAAPADPYVGFPSILRSPVVMPVPALAALDLGLLDRSNLTLRVSLFSEPKESAKGRELQSPLLLNAGRFDLSFIGIVLLPLALLALLFAQPGDDRDAARLPLLAAQASPTRLYLQRYLVRALALVLPFAAITAATALTAGAALAAWLLWIAPIVGWALLWCGSCAWLAARTRSAATALAWLVTLWVSLLWLLPAAVDAFAARSAPTPPALALLGAERAAAQQAQRQREALFGAYVSDHPELSVKTTDDAVAWTRSYYVQQRFVAEAMDAPRTAAQAQHDAHRRLRAQLIWFSPAQALSAASARSAGTDGAHFARFMAAAEAHKQVWDEALFRPLLAGHNLSSSELDALPSFVAPAPVAAAKPALALFALFALIGLLLWRAARWQALSVSH